jgi:hypothetical protein
MEISRMTKECRVRVKEEKGIREYSRVRVISRLGRSS